MNANDCVFVIYENYFGIATKEEWNHKGGYVPDHQSTPEVVSIVKGVSPNFEESAESMWRYRGGKKTAEGRKLLLEAGLTEVKFKELV